VPAVVHLPLPRGTRALGVEERRAEKPTADTRSARTGFHHPLPTAADGTPMATTAVQPGLNARRHPRAKARAGMEFRSCDSGHAWVAHGRWSLSPRRDVRPQARRARSAARRDRRQPSAAREGCEGLRRSPHQGLSATARTRSIARCRTSAAPPRHPLTRRAAKIGQVFASIDRFASPPMPKGKGPR
jgi:hypothetical protein